MGLCVELEVVKLRIRGFNCSDYPESMTGCTYGMLLFIMAVILCATVIMSITFIDQITNRLISFSNTAI